MSGVVELLCSRRVPQVAVLALMSFGFAGCSADMSSPALAKLLFQSLCLAAGSHRLGAGRRRSSAATCRNMPGRNRRYQSQALPPPLAAPQSYPARKLRRVRRRARARLLCAAGPAAARDHRHRRAALGRSHPCAPAQAGTTIIVGTSDTLEVLARRYNVTPAAILQANGYKGPRALSPGQQLIIPHPTAAAAAPAHRRAGEQAGCGRARRRRAFTSSIPAIRCSASRVTTMCRWPNSPRPTTSMLGQTQARHQADRARREDRGGCACRARAVPRSSRVAVATRAGHQDGCGSRSRSKARGWPRPPRRLRKPAAETPVKAARSDRRAADLPLAGARQGDHELRRQDQRQVQ